METEISARDGIMTEVQDALESIMELNQQGYVVLNRSGLIVFWSKGMERITGLWASEVSNKNLENIFPALGTGEHRFGRPEKLNVPVDLAGGKKVVKVTFTQIPSGLVAFFTDVTEQENALDLQRETESRFKNMANCSPVMLWMSGTDSLCNFFNQTWLDFTGRRFEEEWGVGWTEGVYFEDFQRCMDTYIESFNARRAFEMEYRLRRSDGVYRWILDRAAPRYTPEGTFAGFVGSCVDITEKKEIESELRNAVTVREEFLSVASHELKTPLTSLNLQLGMFEHLLRSPDAKEQLLERMDRIVLLSKKQIGQLRRLIDGLLDVSRAAAGKLVLEKEQLDLTALLNEIVEGFRENIKEKGIDIVWQSDGPIVGLWDRTRLEQILMNLLSNGVKYGDGKPIHVGVEDRGPSVLIKIKDHGPGIPSEQMDLIFQKFHRAKRKTKADGLGLGLFITRQIVDQHGGKISVESLLGEGSAFVVELPKS